MAEDENHADAQTGAQLICSIITLQDSTNVYNEHKKNHCSALVVLAGFGTGGASGQETFKLR
jgi:hypothetical protein